jgi:hypothetical protein
MLKRRAGEASQSPPADRSLGAWFWDQSERSPVTRVLRLAQFALVVAGVVVLVLSWGDIPARGWLLWLFVGGFACSLARQLLLGKRGQELIMHGIVLALFVVMAVDLNYL